MIDVETPSVAELLAEERGTIVAAAAAAIARSRVRHYEATGAAVVVDRLETFYGLVVDAAASRDLGDVVAYARALADERFVAGYDLCEVQTALNALEEAAWSRIFARLRPDRVGEPLAVVATVFGAAKDALARQYVELAARTRSPALDVAALFAGSAGAA